MFGAVAIVGRDWSGPCFLQVFWSWTFFFVFSPRNGGVSIALHVIFVRLGVVSWMQDYEIAMTTQRPCVDMNGLGSCRCFVSRLRDALRITTSD